MTDISLRVSDISLRNSDISLRTTDISLRRKIFTDKRKTQAAQGFPGFSLPPRFVVIDNQ